MKPRKLAEGGVMTNVDQLRAYGEMMGERAAARQVELAKKERGLCICKPRKVRIETGYATKSTRTVHHLDCPRWKPWMEEYDKEDA